jgi:hypothetical protein
LTIEVAIDLLGMEEAVDGTSWLDRYRCFGLLLDIVRIDHSIVFFAEVGCLKDQLFNVILQPQ